MNRGQRQIITLLPVDTSGLPKVDAPIPKPSIEHSLMQCPKCNRDCWIGPAQKVKLVFSGAEAACYYCMARMLFLREVSVGSLIALDASADTKPRRT